MTVRYKSATLDEFIEHHSYDVSRGGMFIKTPSPFPPGTLLKFEVKIAADQKVIQGVGRVVWKRDSETQGDVRPAGMGVKFIKIDDASRKVIDTLVESRGDAASAYEAGGGDSGNLPAPATITAPASAPAAASSKTPALGPEASKPPNLRKSTMIGLGSMNPSNRPPVSTTPEKPAASFFPETKSEAEMPAPEDRTVMKQAAELLQDALREAGGSMSEVAPSSKPADLAAKSAPLAAAAPESKRPAEPPVSAPVAASVQPKSETKPVSEKPAAVSVKPSSAKPTSARPVSVTSAARKAGPVSAAPASRRVSVPA
ncbi:MAG TPA: TIGR02266 family protein, partial [Polyangiaceae bacterium]|nr:TIGR02266 family protein [Polyangiaceae bacterium]